MDNVPFHLSLQVVFEHEGLWISGFAQIELKNNLQEWFQSKEEIILEETPTIDNSQENEISS